MVIDSLVEAHPSVTGTDTLYAESHFIENRSPTSSPSLPPPAGGMCTSCVTEFEVVV